MDHSEGSMNGTLTEQEFCSSLIVNLLSSKWVLFQLCFFLTIYIDAGMCVYVSNFLKIKLNFLLYLVHLIKHRKSFSLYSSQDGRRPFSNIISYMADACLFAQAKHTPQIVGWIKLRYTKPNPKVLNFGPFDKNVYHIRYATR